MLIWTNHYEGLIDGRRGAGTISAIKRFQRKLSHDETGELTPEEEHILKNQGAAQKSRFDFREVVDRDAGVKLGIPHALISTTAKTKWGRQWYGKAAGLAIDTLRIQGDVSLRQLYDRLLTLNDRRVTYQRFVDDKWFVISAFENNSAVYVRAEIVRIPGQADEIRGFSIWMDKNRPKDYETLAPAMLSSFSTTEAPQSTAYNKPERTRVSPSTTGALREPSSAPADSIGLQENPPPIQIERSPASVPKVCINGLGYDCPRVLTAHPQR